MSKKIRNIFIVFIILIIILVFYIIKLSNDKEENIKIISGTVVDKNEIKDKNYIDLEVFGKDEKDLNNMTFKVDNEQLWDSISKNKYYFITYYADKNNKLVLKDVQRNDSYGEIYEQFLTKQSQEEVKVEDEREENIAIFSSKDKLSTKDLTLLDNSSVDINKDGKEEKIELYTTAQKDSKGEVMWDDGQKWFLLLKNDKEYVLFDDYIQLGTLEFWVYTSKDEYHILTLQTGTAVLKFSDYTYDKDKDCFVKKHIFNPEYLNLIYSSCY